MSKIIQTLKTNLSTTLLHQREVSFSFGITLSILAGILIGTSFIPFPPWAIFFAMVPLMVAIQLTQNFKNAIFFGWITSFVLTAIGFNWIVYTAMEFGHLPAGIGVIALILYSSFANIDIPIAIAIWMLIRKHTKINANISLAALCALLCLAKSTYPTIFRFDFGYPFLAFQIPIFQLAEWIGFLGLNALVVFVNGLIALSLLSPKPLRFKLLSAAVLIIGLSYGAGKWIERSLPDADLSAPFLIVQGNIGNLDKFRQKTDADVQMDVTRKYIELTREGVENSNVPIDFVLWPETAYPVLTAPPFDSDVEYVMLQSFLKGKPFRLITGGYGLIEEERKVTNSLFIFNQNGELQLPYYSKTHLLAFGEYIPMVDIFPWLTNFVPSGEFGRGRGPQVFEAGHIKIGPQICYESLFPYFSRELARQNVDVIVNVTNDSWFGDWAEPYQHMYMTLARAIEVRRPLVRGTNTGISTAITANGKVLEMSPLGKEHNLVLNIPYYSNPKTTFYVKYPYLVEVLLGFLILGIVGFGTAKKAKARIMEKFMKETSEARRI